MLLTLGRTTVATRRKAILCVVADGTVSACVLSKIVQSRQRRARRSLVAVVSAYVLCVCFSLSLHAVFFFF